MLRARLEALGMMCPDRHDHGAVHMTRGRQETLRSAERPAARLEARDLDPWGVLQNLHLRQVRSVHLQVQRALVRLEPKFLSELIPGAFLPHGEGTLAKPARQGSGNRERLPELEDPLGVCVLLAKDLAAAWGETDPLPARRQVSGAQAIPR